MCDLFYAGLKIFTRVVSQQAVDLYMSGSYFHDFKVVHRFLRVRIGLHSDKSAHMYQLRVEYQEFCVIELPFQQLLQACKIRSKRGAFIAFHCAHKLGNSVHVSTCLLFCLSEHKLGVARFARM